MFMLGITVGNWGLDMFWVAPIWSQIIISHSLTYATIGVPLALLVIKGGGMHFRIPKCCLSKRLVLGLRKIVLNVQEREFSGAMVAGHAHGVNLFWLG